MRDVQHILVFTAVQFIGADKVPWITNKAGFKYSDNFGFGLLNASQMVHAAKVCLHCSGEGGGEVSFMSSHLHMYVAVGKVKGRCFVFISLTAKILIGFIIDQVPSRNMLDGGL